ncbi:Mco32p KNAG_0D04050 [Huiozyma naganishii CBS 8797]|uniref:Uncharacterized protein n=1 Tax=Huiozyma naganishii (strain ATCC MYA-139 / BCRC 22969 / CBS 8797 / KCTC 17520 / NBRC 10181 / NCYC 3082 / Yp74L-3) TaxID=1071383 RepID=J7S773_HUIN7|nr:hypothetical protein KNAG_0D04050 [Kazachstania naganishii CBS 8797]CCK70151.1 hypothetical protein KNAG_0D04050 [Kazachstania naganishii CBS 8797]
MSLGISVVGKQKELLRRTFLTVCRSANNTRIPQGRYIYRFPRRYLVNDATKRANLGSMVEYLRDAGVPNILQRDLSPSTLEDSVSLRLFPLSLGYIPTIQGRKHYVTTMGALRILVASLLGDKSNQKVKIISLDVVAGELPKLSVTNNEKISVQWQTGSDEHTGDKTTYKSLRGVFLLELNDSCDKILVHTIEKVQMVNMKMGQKTNKLPFVC